MVGFVDVLKGVTDVLRANFQNITVYGGEVKEGFKRPSFFIDILPISSETLTKNIVSTELLVVVAYFSPTTEQLSNYTLMSDLKQSFGLVLKVGDRKLTIKDAQIEKGNSEGDCYKLLFSIAYKELVNYDTEPELMGEVVHKIEGVK